MCADYIVILEGFLITILGLWGFYVRLSPVFWWLFWSLLYVYKYIYVRGEYMSSIVTTNCYYFWIPPNKIACMGKEETCRKDMDDVWCVQKYSDQYLKHVQYKKPLFDRKVSQQKGRFCQNSSSNEKKLCQSKKSNTPHALLGLENPGGIYASVTNQGLLSKKKFWIRALCCVSIRDILIECSKQFKWNLYFYVSWQSGRFGQH